MKCSECGKETQVTKLFLLDGKQVELCEKCYKPYYDNNKKRRSVKPISESTVEYELVDGMVHEKKLTKHG